MRCLFIFHVGKLRKVLFFSTLSSVLLASVRPSRHLDHSSFTVKSSGVTKPIATLQTSPFYSRGLKGQRPPRSRGAYEPRKSFPNAYNQHQMEVLGSFAGPRVRLCTCSLRWTEQCRQD